ncbi:MAG: GNAT family N-acetyltransferase [Terracidiphilus sp.]
MNTELRIRSMTPADIPAVAALAESLPAAPHWPQSTYEFALNPASQPERIALLAEGPDGTLAGFAIASIASAEAELESTAVATRFQRQGVAGSLFRRLATLLRERAVQTVFLEVRASSKPARGLYAGLGFAESGRRKGYYADPAEDAVIFRLEIGC